MCNKPLFIPMNKCYYNQFVTGKKDTEYRQYGPRWNEKTCYVGRMVVLSMGYGKTDRTSGIITAFRNTPRLKSKGMVDYLKCFTKKPTGSVAELDIKILQRVKTKIAK